MEIHEILWNLMKSHEIHENLWNLMNTHEISWKSMKSMKIMQINEISASHRIIETSSLGSSAAEAAACKFRLVAFAWERSLRNLRLETLAWELSLVSFRVSSGKLVCELSLGNFGSRISNWENWSPEAVGTGWRILGEPGGAVVFACSLRCWVRTLLCKPS